MLPIEISVSEELAVKLRNMRKSNLVYGEVMTAEKLSKAIHNDKSFVSQLENNRLKYVKCEDIVKIYSIILGCDIEYAVIKVESDLCSIVSKQKNGKIYLSNIQREKIKEIRKDRNITGDALSIEIGKSKGWYSQIENGRNKKIEISDFKLIIEKLECSIHDIIGNKLDYDEIPEDIYVENSILKQENEMLKAKLQSIMEIVKTIDLEKE